MKFLLHTEVSAVTEVTTALAWKLSNFSPEAVVVASVAAGISIEKAPAASVVVSMLAITVPDGINQRHLVAPSIVKATLADITGMPE